MTPNLYTYTIFEPRVNSHQTPQTPPPSQGQPDDDFISEWIHETSPSFSPNSHKLDDFTNSNIQPTAYMANLIDEYLFTCSANSSPRTRPKDKVPKITSVILSPPKFKIDKNQGTKKSMAGTKRNYTTDKSSNGCYICRVRHKKCDEERPICKNCSIYELDCEFPGINQQNKPIYLTDKNAKNVKLEQIKQKTQQKFHNKTTN
ncbi:Lysine biosynthesis regulatory protein [Wickerhamomyces ciferrii]|uniref:Lysine biosynthesis regulatory protein n=1 Tax=Wickerhamomyces ciferrii (strain ATCC 14091 / BCRC 22168 / CBS 111 / JCM 3599 / NBRC 0793 / NRRL Y-1031 F-60-10) TaxID=1206466 RepID=K0KIU6_WICCF|nr:Lysine biosynthesis regulatory protein [Wickerhamomyces ciferrii]CCH41339.1 Lysine biosynthesis regulatory protein [Wickerhamomyces ciferrii]